MTMSCLRCILALALSGHIVRAGAGESITFFHNDFAGTPVVATDANGFEVWRETYRPYGTRLIESSASSPNQLWFTGKPQDDASGLIYMGARYYDPFVGRFTSIDPAPIAPNNIHSINRYSYANNNPLRYFDPTGQWSLSINLGILSPSIGQDEYSGQFFWTLRVGMTGAGIAYDPSKNAPRGEGRMRRPCLTCMAKSVSWQQGNVKAGIVAGPFSWQPIENDLGTSVVGEHFEGGESHYYSIDGQGWNFDLFNFQSVLSDGEERGEAGINLDLEANWEWGSTVSWEALREALGLKWHDSHGESMRSRPWEDRQLK